MVINAIVDAVPTQDSFVFATKARSLLVGDLRPSQEIILSPAFICIAVETSATNLFQATLQPFHSCLLDLVHLAVNMYFWLAQPLIIFGKALLQSVDKTCANPGQSPKVEECNICWDPIHKHHDRGFCTRGHRSFHKGCLLKWKKESKTCPLCRSELLQN